MTCPSCGYQEKVFISEDQQTRIKIWKKHNGRYGYCSELQGRSYNNNKKWNFLRTIINAETMDEALEYSQAEIQRLGLIRRVDE